MAESTNAPTLPDAPPTEGRSFKALGSFLGLAMLCIALWFLHRELAGITRTELLAHVVAIPISAILMAVGFAVCSYLSLTGYDATALKYLKRQVPFRQSAITSFMAYAVGHNVGIAALSGGAIRYRMYSQIGIPASEIATIVVFTTTTFFLGAATLIGIALLLLPTAQVAILRLPSPVVNLLGWMLLSVPACYLLLAAVRKRPFTVGSWQIDVPPVRIALTQLVIAIADLSFAAATLFVLLAPLLDMSFLSFLGIYLLAVAAGVLSSIPGGIGVIEAVLLATLPGIAAPVLLGNILVFRLIYYVAPLVMALALLVTQELKVQGDTLRNSPTMIGTWFSAIAPQVVAMVVFLAGVVLLISGASPAISDRLGLIARVVPATILELSHLLGSVAGLALLILAQGLHRRLRNAYRVALFALSAGVALSLLKALDYEEAFALAIVALILWLSRGEYYRLGTLAPRRFSVQWSVAILIALALMFWVGLLSYSNSPYTGQSWWHFAIHADAPRTVRAAIVVSSLGLAYILWSFLRRGPPSPSSSLTADDRAALKVVLTHTQDTSANVALLADKRLFWSTDRSAFLMYQISGNSWITLGDPVGPESQWEELLWAFREEVDRHNGRPVFYQVSETSLALYVDLGMTLAKLGEDARVPLTDFTIQGSARADLRQALNRAKKLGASFEVIPQAGVPEILPRLRQLSEEWLKDKQAVEKGFSLGAFSEDYVANFDCGVVRVAGQIVAFVNLWQAPAGGELSVDLMRYGKDAPKGVMDYLFVELMLWGKQQGYAWFNLGMAPLSGMEQSPLAPTWHKVGHLIFTQGEAFYNFEGLRQYKEKFDPQWRARYLACPGGWLNLPRALFDSASLISGGVLAILKK